jgi:glyoxylase-like metal-dependent hydrolase (beta-lactamase superfamily II)
MLTPLAPGVSFLDLQFQATPRIIATAVLRDASGVALVDPGPGSSLPMLRGELGAAGVSSGEVTAVLLTHIHLDHAGCVGALVRENPRLRVYVHEKGAPHLSNPDKLIASATRLYGDAMGRLWGDILPVPTANVVPLKGDERLQEGGRRLEVAYTPGHASHLVSYFSPETGIAFVGDTAGIKRGPREFVLPPTPPPDIDVELWRGSLSRIAAWNPDTLFVTHFGPHGPSAPHLAEMGEHLAYVEEVAKASLAREEGEEAREQFFVEAMRRELCRGMNEREAHAYELAARFDLSWRGIVRYLRKRGL